MEQQYVYLPEDCLDLNELEVEQKEIDSEGFHKVKAEVFLKYLNSLSMEQVSELMESINQENYDMGHADGQVHVTYAGSRGFIN